MNAIKSAWGWMNKTWCEVAHPSPLWPIHGRYRCPVCLRETEVEWEVSIHRPARAQTGL